MCREYIKGGNPWEYCPYVYQTYQEAKRFLDSRAGGEDFGLILEKMQEFKYTTNIELKADIEKVTGKKSGLTLTTLKVPKGLTDSLRKMIESMKNADSNDDPRGADDDDERPKEERAELEESEPIASEWYTRRLQPLSEIATAPLHLKKPFELTPVVLSARLGTSEPHLQHGSIAEVLFMTESGVCAPMPYSSSRAEVPRARCPSFVRDAMRRYVAQSLAEIRYKETTVTALEIVTDIVFVELESICRDAASSFNKSHGKATPESCVLKALRNRQYSTKSYD